MVIVNEKALSVRANNLGTRNGVDFVLVTSDVPSDSDSEQQVAVLEVHFHNENLLAEITAAIAGGSLPKTIFPIRGGHRVRGGPSADNVFVQQVAGGGGDVLRLTTNRVGDYSTYQLEILFPDIDPVFGQVLFKFRPGCFSTDCSPTRQRRESSPPSVAIDYLAKDFDSFKHLFINAVQQRVPGWQPTSEVDMTQVLINLLSATADELSDFQDRVVNEAYVGRARKRVSLARYARLMNYHIQEGNQASTWLVLEAATGSELVVEAGFEVATFHNADGLQGVRFRTREDATVSHLLNSIELFTWQHTKVGLAKGSTSADLAMRNVDDANAVKALINSRTLTHLLIQEHRDPHSGRIGGRDTAKRQLLRLKPNAEAIQDQAAPLPGLPAAPNWMVQVNWESGDALLHDYCAIAYPEDGAAVERVFLFHGNLVAAYQGTEVEVVFREPGERLNDGGQIIERYYERARDPARDVVGSWKPETSRSVICRLPEDRPLLYRDVTGKPGELPAQSTLRLEGEEFCEVINLVSSDDSSPHFVVETDEDRRSILRFGNGVNGKELPDNTTVHCRYQSGFGPNGNVGADRLVHFDRDDHTQLTSVRNPFPVTDGRAPEPAVEILRNAVEAWKAGQQRAVSLQDYRDRAEEVSGVSRAAARYAWTGSWRTVRIAIDPVGTDELPSTVRRNIAAHLDGLRLIGDDLEIRAARFIPVIIGVSLCAEPEVWPRDVYDYLLEEFSDTHTSDGRLGFFHPDRWTFGQPLHASEILGRVHRVAGVHHVFEIVMRRFDNLSAGTKDTLEFDSAEILQVRNDPDHMEKGSIEFHVQGGRG